MAHEILSSYFYSDRNVPAWHKKDILREKGLEGDMRPRKATEVLGLFDNPQVVMQPLSWTLNGQTYTSGYNAIVRLPLPGELAPSQLGVVGEQYHLITPTMAAEMCDRRIKAEGVETMAMLRNGAIMFVTYQLPKMNVRGDEVNNYLILYNPMDGNHAAAGYVSQVRVVCMNTLQMAISGAISSFKIHHSSGAAQRLELWLGRTYDNSLAVSESIQQAYDLLAATKIKKVDVKMIAETVYRSPKRPVKDVPRKTPWGKVMEEFNSRKEWVDTAHKTILELYEGRGMGSDTPAFKGTAWGAFNAVAEFATYRRGTTDSMAQNGITGDRAREIRKASELCLKLASPSTN